MTGVPQDFNRYRQVFESADANSDGFLNAKELLAALDALGRPARPGGAEELMRTYDADHSGSIDFEEFVALLAGTEDSPGN